jgi:hypothetical protein
MPLNFETNKPKLFWLIIFIAAIIFFVGIPSALIALTSKSMQLQIVVFRLFVFLWSAGFVLTITYLVRQAAGKYIGIGRKPISEQIW